MPGSQRGERKAADRYEMLSGWSATTESMLGLPDTVLGLLDTALGLCAKVAAGRHVGESARTLSMPWVTVSP